MQVKFSWRVLVLAAVVALHWLALAWLSRNAVPATFEQDAAFRVEFVEAPIVIRPPPPIPPVPASTSTPHRLRAPSTPPQTTPALQMIEPPTHAPAPEPTSLYGPDGRLRLPADLMEQIDRKFGDQREFSFQMPHADDAAKYFDRPKALAFESTRFDQYWKPDQDLLTDLLTQAVEKTTKEIRIPIPGNPREHVVCRISMLAMGGGCGIEVAGSDYTGPKDDPNTLSPEEDRQCQAWWNKIIASTTQDEWRATRKLYEQECRKPLERRPEQVPDPGPPTRK
jgi:hypothetical protein